MQFLLKDEIEFILNTCTEQFAHTPPEEVLIDPDINSFEIFRFYVFCLLNKSNDSSIRQFIRAYPSSYDPVTDIFVQDSRSD